jgi:hypothetical protein
LTVRRDPCGPSRGAAVLAGCGARPAAPVAPAGGPPLCQPVGAATGAGRRPLVAHRARVQRGPSQRAFLRNPAGGPPTRRFFVPLTYGPNARWCLNVVAADGCRVRLRGREYEASHPQVVGRGALPPSLRAAYRLIGMREFLALTVREPR